MRTFYSVFTFFSLSLLLVSCNNEKAFMLASPSGDLEVNFILSENRQPAYNVFHKNNSVIENSSMGFSFTNMPE